MEILSLTALELGKKIQEREISAVEAVNAVIGQVKAVEHEIHSYVTLDEEGALQYAGKIQGKIDKGVLNGPLAGVPAAVKDNICIEG